MTDEEYRIVSLNIAREIQEAEEQIRRIYRELHGWKATKKAWLQRARNLATRELFPEYEPKASDYKKGLPS